MKKAFAHYLSYPANREAIYDFIRVFACISVVGIHTVGDVYDPVGVFFETLFRIGLPLFFVMSGALLLGGKEKPSDEHLLIFYLRRVESVLLPFLIYVLIYGCWVDQGHLLPEVPTGQSVSEGFRLIPQVLYENLTSLKYEHFWFVYEIIGLYLITPFLKKGMHALSAAFLKKLFFVILIVMAIAVYLPLIGLNLYFTNYFDAWIIYFLIGYVLTRKEMESCYPALAIAGGVTFLFMIFWHYYLPNITIAHFYDLSPHMILAVSGVFSLCMLYKKQPIHSGKINWRMMHLGKYSFSVYLIHIVFLWYYMVKYPDYKSTGTGIFLAVLVVYGKSLLFAIIFDNLITFNLKRLFRLAVGGIQKLFGKTVSGGSR